MRQTLSLDYQPPYDWDAMIGFLSDHATPGVEHVEAGLYARTITFNGVAGTIEIRPSGNALAATIRFPDTAALPEIIHRIRRLFDLDADPAVIAAHLGADPMLARHVAARPGLRVPGAWDGFELAVRAILGQQISVAAATRLAGKFTAAYGEPVLAHTVPGLTRVFPSPERLAGEDIAACLGMPRARGAALSTIAASSVSDPALFAPAGGIDAAVARLKALRGIGPWTAHYVAMRALQEPDAFPTGDIGLLRAMATPDGRPTFAEADARANAWRPWRSYAALHLWTSLGSPPEVTVEAAA